MVAALSPPAAPAVRRFRTVVVTVAVALFALVAGGTIHELTAERTYLERMARDDAYARAVSLAEIVSRSVHTVAGVLDRVASDVKSTSATHLETPAVPPQWLQGYADLEPLIDGLSIVDAGGRVLARTVAGAPVHAGQELPALIETLSGSEAGTVVQMRAGTADLVLARRLTTDGNRLVGIVVASLDTRALTASIEKLGWPPASAFLLVHRNGLVVTRLPENGLRGTSIADRPLFTEQIAYRDSGIFEAPPQTDGLARVTAFAKAAPYPLYVAIGIGRDQLLTPWRNAVRSHLVFLVLIGGVIAAATWLIIRQDRSLRHYLGSLEEARCQLADKQDRLTASVRRQHIIATLSQAAVHEDDIDRFLGLVAETVGRGLGVEHCAVFRRLADGSGLDVVADYGWRESRTPRDPKPLNDPHAWLALAIGEPVVVTSYTAERRFDPAPAVMAHGAVCGVAAPIRVSDGAYGVLVIHSAQPNAVGESDVVLVQAIAYLVGSLLDRHRDARLREAVLDGVAAEIAVLDGTGVIMMVNERWEAFARSNGAADPIPGVGNSYLEVCEHAQGDGSCEAEAMAEGIRDVLAGRRDTFSLEYPCDSRNEVRWFRALVAPVVFNHMRGAAVMHVDITDQRQTEAQLREAQRMEAVGQLTGGIAHDFNNMLTVIQGNVELLAESERLSDEERDMADLIRTAARRAAETTGRLLAFARRQTLHPTLLDVGSVLCELGSLLKHTMPESIQVEIVPPSASIQCRVDHGQLQTALINLAFNARDAMPDGGTLRLEAHRFSGHLPTNEKSPAGDWVEILVEDTGCGMQPDVAAHVFEPFFTTKDPGRGTGLGLSMVWGFVRQSGGGTTIDTRPGEGTRCRMYFPAHDDVGVCTHEEIAVAASFSGDGKVVLLVEDDALVRRHVASTLAHMGFAVRTAENGRSVVDDLTTLDGVDIVISDIVMPGGISGHALANIIRCRVPSLPILLVTGYDDNCGARPALAAPIEIISKPFRHADLANALNTLFSRDAA